MLRTLRHIHVLSSPAALAVFDRYAHGELQLKHVRQELLRTICEERQDELGRWPAHQEQAAEPRGENLALGALVHLARRLLCWRAGAVELRPERLLEWREQLAHRVDLDLLVMTAAALELWRDDADGDGDGDDDSRYQTRELSETLAGHITGAPFVPPVALPELQALEAEGLVELHRHLTLARLPSEVWCKLLAEDPTAAKNPVQARRALPAPYSGWPQALGHARALRGALVELVLDKAGDALAALKLPGATARLSSRPLIGKSDAARALPGARDGAVSRERALVIRAIQRLTSDPPLYLAEVFHAYVIVRQRVVSAIIQPPEGRKGLDRFRDQYVDNPVHDVEKHRGLWSAATQAYRTGGVRWLEGKVAPKPIREHLDRILPVPSGRLSEVRTRPGRPDYSALFATQHEAQMPAIRLVFHFLRAHDRRGKDDRLTHIAYTNLRQDVYQQALMIAEDLACSDVQGLLVGLDVAGSETAAPIEVFAPTLRALRAPWQAQTFVLTSIRGGRAPSLGLSIHAGEEFHHIVEGIRHVVETILFCDMHGGDRLGHALAIGLEPMDWAERWNYEALMPRRVRLDDVVWMWHALDSFPQHAGLRTRLLHEARRLFQVIYSEEMPEPQIMKEAWLLRAHDPLSRAGPDAPMRRMFTPLGKQMKRSLDLALNRSNDKCGPKPEALWWRTLTDAEVARRGAESVAVSLNEQELCATRDLQDAVIRDVVRRRIVIEANPSSNLAISPITRIQDHPIFRWAPPEGGDEHLRPIVVVCSDDPGIFGSELLHEFALLALAAEQRGATPRTIRRWLRELQQDAMMARFGATTSGQNLARRA